MERGKWLSLRNAGVNTNFYEKIISSSYNLFWLISTSYNLFWLVKEKNVKKEKFEKNKKNRKMTYEALTGGLANFKITSLFFYF